MFECIYILYFCGKKNEYMCYVTSLFFGTRKEERESFVDLSAWNQTGCGRSPSRSKNNVDLATASSKGEIILPRYSKEQKQRLKTN